MTRNTFYSIIATILLLHSIATIAARPSTPIKVACIGDSITYGGGGKYSYPSQLAVTLGDQWSVENFGVNGATLLKNGDNPYWDSEQYEAALKFKPDVVVIKLGTNDSKPGNWKHKTEYVPNYVELIKSFQNLESKPTVWISYPVPAYSGGWGISDKVIREEMIPLIDEVAKNTDVKIIDLYSSLSGRQALFPDSIHPSAEGARLIAKIIARTVAEGH